MTAHGITLLIDAGNTRVKFGWLQHSDGQREASPLALAHAELDRLPAWLATLPVLPEQALGVSVAGPAIAQALEHTLQQQGAPVRWLRSSARAAGIVNLYDIPEQLGNDRWVALLGLGDRTSTAAVLASFGTATTVDTLSPQAAARSGTVGRASRERRFEGGLILPGPELMRRSLATGTAGLPYAQGSSVAFPRNTHAAISSGVAAAQAGAVLRQWRCAYEQLGVAPHLYCTGGGWPLVAGEVTAALAGAQADLGLPPLPPQWLDAPVLDGLARMAMLPA